MPPTPVIVATAQSRISADVRRNGRHIRALMRRARAAGADLIHFPEGAASGYVENEIRDWADVDWEALRDELARTRALAGELGIWVVLGSNHRLPGAYPPHNSLYVISDRGVLHGRYDKRWCSHDEIHDWYSPGTAPFVFEVNGLRFGCAICIEIQFPEVFLEYLRLGVHCVLLSSYADIAMFGVQARGYAASLTSWFSLSNPVNASSTMPAVMIGPSGEVVSRCRRNRAGLIVTTLDPDAPEWEIPLRRARPWREIAREGGVYRDRRVPELDDTGATRFGSGHGGGDEIP